MNTLDVQSRLECARAAVAVLRALTAADATVSYRQFAIAIGLIADGGKWEPWHRQQTRDILNVVAAVERQAGENAGADPLEFERIVKQQDGEPGAGLYKSSRIVTD